MPKKSASGGKNESEPLVVRPEKPYEKPETLVEWEAPRRVFRKRPTSWFAGLFLLALILSIVFILIGQLTLVLVVVAFVFAVYSLNRVEPPHITNAVRTTGVRIGGKEYLYDRLKWFWIRKEEDQSVLYISTYLNVPHLLTLLLPKEKQSEIEKRLLKYLPYHEEKGQDYMDWLDGVIGSITPRLPQSVVDLYAKFLG